MIDIVPAVLPKSYGELSAKVGLVRDLVKRVQIDVTNGTYASSTTWPYGRGDYLEETLDEYGGLPFWDEMDYEVDLLIAEPEKEIDRWIQAGVAVAIVHVETTEEIQVIIKKLQEVHAEVGLGIKPSTSNDELYRYIDLVDFVQCMGNDQIGYHGVSLDESVYEKINHIRARYPDLPIAVDIGVNIETAPKLIEAGATKLVSGSAIFASENINEAIRDFKEL